MLQVREEEGGQILYDAERDVFTVRLCQPYQTLRTDRPLSITCSLEAASPAENALMPYNGDGSGRWIDIFRQLRLWNLFRLHIPRAERLSNIQWILSSARELGIHPVLSVETCPPDLPLS